MPKHNNVRLQFDDCRTRCVTSKLVLAPVISGGIGDDGRFDQFGIKAWPIQCWVKLPSLMPFTRPVHELNSSDHRPVDSRFFSQVSTNSLPVTAVFSSTALR